MQWYRTNYDSTFTVKRPSDEGEKNIYLHVYLILFIFPQFLKLKLQI